MKTLTPPSIEQNVKLTQDYLCLGGEPLPVQPNQPVDMGEVVVDTLWILDRIGNPREDLDVADIVIQPGAHSPIECFASKRQFFDVPVSGSAWLLLVTPEGEYFRYLYTEESKSAAWFGQGATMVWIVAGDEPFRFIEVCHDAFDPPPGSEIKPGEEGILYLDPSNCGVDGAFENSLPTEFWVDFSTLTGGEI